MLFLSEWDDVVSTGVLIWVVPIYLAVVFSLKMYMSWREPFELMAVLKGYNAVQIAVSAFMTFNFAINLSPWNPFMLNTEFTEHVERWCFFHYIAKYLDLFETVVIVLRKRNSQLTTLHLFHHSSILIIWGFLLQAGLANGTASFGAFINSLVHTLMYGYLYGHGDSSSCMVVINKNSVVICQIGQFISCIAHAVLAIVFEEKIPFKVCLLQLAYHLLLVHLFVRASRQAQVC